MEEILKTDKHGNKLQFLIVILVFLLLQVPFLDSVRRIVVDESWYANVAYNFSVGNGFINTNVGAFGGDICFLYPLIEGTFFFIFGTSLFAARLVSLFAGVISIFGILSILNYLKIKSNIKYISVFLLIFSYNYFLIFRCARPEAWVFVFLIWMLYYQVRFWYENKNIYLFLMGMSAGISFLFHPWGFAFALLFGIYSIIISFSCKSVKPLLIYTAGIIPFVLLLLLNSFVISGISFSTFLSRFSGRSTATDSGINYFIKVKLSVQGLFVKYDLKSGRAFIVLFHALTAFFGLTFYRKNKNIFRISVLQLALFVITILFYSGGGMEYMLHFLFVFTFFNIALLMNENILKYHLNKIIMILSLLFFLNNIIGIFAIEKKEYGNPYSEVEKNIRQYIPKSSVVLSPIELWFPCRESEFYNSNTLWSFEKYKDVNELLGSKTVDYVIKSDGISDSQTEENINAVDKYVSEKGIMIYTLPTKNFGNISVWKVNK